MRSVYVPQFDGHIAVSRYTADEVQTGMRPVHIAPMGVDYPRFVNRRSSEVREHLFGAALRHPHAVVLLYVGRLSGEKNIPLLLDVMGILTTRADRHYHLYVAGDGPLRGWMEEEGRRRAPGRVHILGHVSDREHLASLYANADVLVHPNPREPLGLAPLEAMASGLPVVAPASGGVLEYASPDNAWLTQPMPARFARAVERVLAHPVLRDSKVTHARATAADLDWHAVTARYFRLYDSIHAARGSREAMASETPQTADTSQLLPLLPRRHRADTSVH
jgi:glycosyltransferase involved in cell wall biosynthesis